MDGVQTQQVWDRCGHEQGAKVPAVVDTLRWRIVCQEMDLSLSVPSNPSLTVPCSNLTLLSWRVFVWHEFRVFVMGALPATLFLLSGWHFRWTRPWLYLRSSSLITMYIILLSLSALQTHTHAYIVSFSPSYFILSVLNMYMHPSHLFILYCLLSLS